MLGPRFHESPPEPCDLSPCFWNQVRHSRHRLLILDYDGTLAPETHEWSGGSIGRPA